MARVGISRTPVKMDTGATNFMAGMAQVQAMQQAQEAHEQQLQQNEVKMTLAQADNARADRAMQIKEQEAYRNQPAFNMGVAGAKARVTSWNGKAIPAWASSGLQGQFRNLNSLQAEIKRKRASGQDATADILAFQALASEYDTGLQAEGRQQSITGLATSLDRMYQETGLQGGEAVQGIIGQVLGSPSDTGYTSTSLTDADVQTLRQEVGRVRAYENEMGTRRALATAMQSNQEIFRMLRAGQVPEGLVISETALNGIKNIVLGADYAQATEDTTTVGSESKAIAEDTISELARLLDPTAEGGYIDAWDIENDVKDVADRLAHIQGLFKILESNDAIQAHDLEKQLVANQRREMELFLKRNATAESILDTVQPGTALDDLTPRQRWALSHREKTRGSRFSLSYDDDADYLTAWNSIEAEAGALGGSTADTAGQMERDYVEARAQRREAQQVMSNATEAQKAAGDPDYWSAVVTDVLASERQLEEQYAGQHPALDRVVNADFFGKVTPVFDDAAFKGQEYEGTTVGEFIKGLTLQLQAGEIDAEKYNKDAQAALKAVKIVMPHESGGWEMTSAEAAASRDLADALKRAGISRADYFGLNVGGLVDGINPLDDPDFELSVEDTSFQQFARRNPKKAERLAQFLSYPDSRIEYEQRNLPREEAYRRRTGKPAPPKGAPSGQYMQMDDDAGFRRYVPEMEPRGQMMEAGPKPYKGAPAAPAPGVEDRVPAAPKPGTMQEPDVASGDDKLAAFAEMLGATRIRRGRDAGKLKSSPKANSVMSVTINGKIVSGKELEKMYWEQFGRGPFKQQVRPK